MPPATRSASTCWRVVTSRWRVSATIASATCSERFPAVSRPNVWGRSNHNARATPSRRDPVNGDTPQASASWSAIPRPTTVGWTPWSICTAVWDRAKRTDSAICNAATPARRRCRTATRSIRTASEHSPPSSSPSSSRTAAPSSTRTCSRCAVSGSTDRVGASISVSAVMDITLRITTDKNRTPVRLGVLEVELGGTDDRLWVAPRTTCARSDLDLRRSEEVSGADRAGRLSDHPLDR